MITNKNVAGNAGIEPSKILGGNGLGSVFGRTYYVQSAHSLAVDQAYDPYQPSSPGTAGRPFATIDYAIGQCEDDRGDVIVVGPGHTETVSAAEGIDADVDGITIIGVGNGSLRPTITFDTATTATMTIAGDDVTVANLLFVSGKAENDLETMVSVSGADAYLYGCEFKDGGATMVPVICLTITTGAARARVEKCEFYCTGADDIANEAILIGAVLDRIRILDCIVMGNFANAAIYSASAFTNSIIRGCLLQNTQTGDHAIELTAAATGFLAYNLYYSDISQGTASDPGSMFSYECYHDDLIDKSGVISPVET